MHRLTLMPQTLTPALSRGEREEDRPLSPGEGNSWARGGPRSGTGGDDGGAGRGLDLLRLAQQRDHAHRGGVPLADLGELVDPGVSPRPALEPRADLVEELEGHVLLGQDGQDAAELVQVPAVPARGISFSG